MKGKMHYGRFDEFKNILVGVDESEGAQKAFQYAVKQASKTGAALLIASILEIEELNVYEALDPEYLSQKQSQLLLNLKKYKQYAENSGVKNIQLTVEKVIRPRKLLRRFCRNICRYLNHWIAINAWN
ncbi:putative universal stress protein [Lactococcus lactis]|nr:putative universal stress protein [Lactococcus lactis]